MRSLAVFSESGAQLVGDNPTLARVSLKGIGVHAALVAMPRTRFLSGGKANATKVLVRVRAFSCNYRDLRILLDTATAAVPAIGAIGSDFCGEVIRVGSEVTQFKPKDRVIPNSAYHVTEAEGSRKHFGIPTNSASTEYLLLDQQQLIAIPHAMSTAHGAAFTIGAQTAYAMVRRLDPKPGATVLVTAGRSSTSLFCMAALRARGLRFFVMTSSADDRERLMSLGAEDVFVVDRNAQAFSGLEPIKRKLGGFDHVIDPYYDIFLSRVLPLLKPHGSYISCGWYEQEFIGLGIAPPAVMTNATHAMTIAVLKNQTLHLNCLGTTQDLRDAINDYVDGRMQVPMDSVYRDGDVAGFLARTYASSEKFGKVVYTYDA